MINKEKKHKKRKLPGLEVLVEKICTDTSISHFIIMSIAIIYSTALIPSLRYILVITYLEIKVRKMSSLPTHLVPTFLIYCEF